MSATLAGLLLHTSPQVPIIFAGAAGRGLGRIEGEVAEHQTVERDLLLLGVSPGVGFAEIANAFGRAIRGDLVLVAPGVRVGPEWLDRLRSAVQCDSTVVSATALGDNAGALSVSAYGRLRSDRAEAVQPQAALAVISGAQRIYPRITSAGYHCVYLSRALLDLLGGFNPHLQDRQEAMAELSLRAVELGMVHVAADDVYVGCPPVPARRERSGSEEPIRSPSGETSVALLSVDELEDRSPLYRCLASARVALHGLSVTIDARALGPGVGGTQLYTLELLLALVAQPGLRIRAVVPPDLPPDVARRLAQEQALEVITYEQAVAGVLPSEIVHRPQQVFSSDDMNLLQLLGERIIVGQQDLIAYRNPSYHATVDGWLRYRRATRLALAAADRVVFFSAHAMSDAVAEDLITRERCDVAGIGTDPYGVAKVEPVPAPGVPLDRDLLVCVGADYRHKNRPFAIVLLEALRRRHGWDGCLVLAGAHVLHGSSRDEEERLLAAHPALAESVIDLGPVDEAQKAWLYERARAVVYPTLYEGFGLVPFEAARSGTPCLFAPQASLVELAGNAAATLVPWDAELSSDAVAALLIEGPEREQHLRLLLDGMALSTWSGVVERLKASYQRAIGAPYRAAAPRAWQELARERLYSSLETAAEDYQEAYHDLRASVGPGLPLVAEGGLLSRDEQRGLMRIASRRSLHGLMLGPIGLLGRLRIGRAGHSEQVADHEGGVIEAEGNAGDDTGPRC